MNDLEKRRALLSDPRHLEASLRDAVESDESLRAFRDELLAMDERVRRVVTRDPVPHGLADRMLLHAHHGSRSAWTLALAAGIAAVTFSVTWLERGGPDLDRAMLAHVRESVGELRDDRGVDPATLRVALAEIGVTAGELPYRVRHLGHCVVAGREGRHITLDIGGQVVSIVMLPGAASGPGPEELGAGDTVGVFTQRGGVRIGTFAPRGVAPETLKDVIAHVVA
jgi:hypothetical protein